MTEILFYHLHGQKLEGVLTPLLEKSFGRGCKVIDAHLVADHDEKWVRCRRVRRSVEEKKPPLARRL